ncbi:MAG: BTAD domain-containing putative transcriptional regulator [Actinomycetota bacterium]
MLAIHLLGKPMVTWEGSPQTGPKGQKAWGLLAYLILSGAPQPREHLGQLLFGDADDPLRALRWNLTELRRVLRAPEGMLHDPVAFDLPYAYVDALTIVRGTWVEALQAPGLGQPLLGSLPLDTSPAFSAWLLNERRHMRASTLAILREAALNRLASGAAGQAIELAARLVALEPFDETYQALLIRSYATSGDRDGAAKQLAACIELFRKELGVEPGPQVIEALHVAAASSTTRSLGGRAAAETQFDAGEAALRGGAIDAGIECLRRSIAEAHACGDIELKARALLALGSALIHWRSHEEGETAVHEAIAAARNAEKGELVAAGCYELAWREFLAARYQRALRWLDEGAPHAGNDPSLLSAIDWIRGKCFTETGRYEAGITLLSSSVDLAERANDPLRLAFSLASLGRSYLLKRDLGPARAVLERSVEVIRSSGMDWFAPCPMSFLAEVLLLEEDLERSSETFEYSFAMARQVNDPMFEAFALRGLALIAARRGDVVEAVARLEDARIRLVGPLMSEWTMAFVLDSLCAIGCNHDLEKTSTWTDDLENLAGRTGMKEMLARAYLYRYRLGSRDALDAAENIARSIDNPQLIQELTAARAEANERMLSTG